MIKVFHNKKAFGHPGMNLAFAPNKKLVEYVGNQLLSDFEHVATINTNDLETAFERTNHIDKAWHENTDVICHKTSRSSSVSDIMEKNGKFYVVVSCGFKEVKKN